MPGFRDGVRTLRLPDDARRLFAPALQASLELRVAALYGRLNRALATLLQRVCPACRHSPMAPIPLAVPGRPAAAANVSAGPQGRIPALASAGGSTGGAITGCSPTLRAASQLALSVRYRVAVGAGGAFGACSTSSGRRRRTGACERTPCCAGRRRAAWGLPDRHRRRPNLGEVGAGHRSPVAGSCVGPRRPARSDRCRRPAQDARLLDASSGEQRRLQRSH